MNSPARLHARPEVVGAALCVAVVVVATALFVIPSAAHPPAMVRRAGDFGPKVLLSVSDGQSTLANNTSVSIQVFSPIPTADEAPSTMSGLHLYPISAQNQWSNGFDEELLNVTLIPQGALDNGVFTTATSFFLPPSFDGIDAEWETILSHDTGKNYPSMTVEAEKTVVGTSGIAIYQYYNNLPYNPFSLQIITLNATALAGGAASWFQGTDVNSTSYSTITVATMALNLSVGFSNRPSQVMSSASFLDQDERGFSISPRSQEASVSLEATPDSTSYIYTYPTTTGDVLVHTSYANGTLPLLGVNIGPNANSGKSLIDLGASVNVLNDTIAFNSNQVAVSSIGTISSTMSTSPSFQHVANITVGAGFGVSNAWPVGMSESLGSNLSVSLNETSAFVGIQGVEFDFAHYNENTYHWTDKWEETCTEVDGNPSCSAPKLVSTTLDSTTYDGNFTSGGIVHINSTGGLKVTAGYVSIWDAWAIQSILCLSSNGSVTLTPTGSESSYSAATIWASTAGYSNAATALGDASAALQLTSTAIDTALALVVVTAAANGADLDASEPAVVAEVAAVIASVTDQASDILNLFSSISSVSGTNAVTLNYGFSNGPQGSGSSYSMPFYESSTPVTFSLNGNTYSFWAPVNYLSATAIV